MAVKQIHVYDFESLKKAKEELPQQYSNGVWMRTLTFQSIDTIMKESPWFMNFSQQVYRIQDILHIIENKEVRKFKTINPLLFTSINKVWFTDEQAMFMAENFSDEQLQYLSSNFIRKLPYNVLEYLAKRVNNEHYKSLPKYVIYVLKNYSDIAIRVQQNNVMKAYHFAKVSMYHKADSPTQEKSLNRTFDLSSSVYEEAGMLKKDLLEYLGINAFFMSLEMGKVKKGEDSVFASLGDEIHADGPVRYPIENVKNFIQTIYCPGPDAPKQLETFPKKLYRVQDLAAMNKIDSVFYIRKIQKEIRDNKITHYRMGAKTTRLDKETFDKYILSVVTKSGDNVHARNRYRVQERVTMTEKEYNTEVLGNTDKYFSRTRLLKMLEIKKIPDVIQEILYNIKNYRRYSQHAVENSHETYYVTEELNEALEKYYGYFAEKEDASKPLTKTRSREYPLYIEKVDKLYTCSSMADYLSDTYGVLKNTILFYIHQEINNGHIPMICFGDEKKNRRHIFLIKEDVLENEVIRQKCKLQ